MDNLFFVALFLVGCICLVSLTIPCSKYVHFLHIESIYPSQRILASNTDTFQEKKVNKFVKPLSASDKNVSGPELRTELQTFTKNHHKSRRHARQLLVWELSQWSKRVMLLKCQIVVTLLVRGFLDNFHYNKKTYHNSEAIAPSGAKSKTIERQ